MDISLIKLVLLVVSPTPSPSPSLLSIFITILPLDMMWPSLVASTIFHQNPSEMTFNWNSTFQIGRQPFGWCWDFSNIGWFWLNSKTRARLLEKCHPIDGRYFELEDNGKPVWSYDVHLPCFPSSGSGFHMKQTLPLNGTFFRHLPGSDPMLSKIWIFPPQRDQKTMMLFMTVSYWIVFIGLDSSRKE